MPGSARKEQSTPTKAKATRARRSLVSQVESEVTPKKKRSLVEGSPVVLVEKLECKKKASKSKTSKSLKLVNCDDDNVEEIKDIPTFSLKRRRASIKPSLEDVTEGSTEDDDDDTREALSMYGKYGRIIGERASKEPNDAPMFGFATPKKNSMMDRTSLVLSASKKTPLSKRMERHTTPSKSPSSAMNTPLSKLRLRGDAPTTPRSVRKKITAKIEKQLDSSESEEESEDDDEDASDDDGVQPLEKDNELDTDEFFEKQSSKHIVTSDKTLNQLKTPRLSPEALKDILSNEPLKYEKAIHKLCVGYKQLFPKWMHFLQQEFNVMLYGLGSKRSLLSDFHAEMLSSEDCVVVNGFFPSISMKHILSVILHDILGYTGNVGSSLIEQAESVMRAYSTADPTISDDLYLVVHNIDGPMLRNEVSQSVLSRLASHPRIHLICSMDHVNAPLLWDQNKLSNYNFIWQDTTTLLPYSEETLNENSLMVRSGGSGLALHSLLRVFESLTPNAKEIYLLIVDTQMKAVEEVGLALYQGLSFKDLYRQCRRAFLVNSDLTLRAQLTEFIDHKLIRNKKGNDGMEYLTIPLENMTLQEFIEKYRNTQ